MKSYALLGQGNFWIISKPLAKIVGIEAALLLSDLVSKHQYFSKRDKIDNEGRFFNTAENIENDTTLSPHKQRKAIKILKDFNLVYTKIKGVPAKLWYGINDLCICELIDIITDLKTIDKDSLEQAVKKFNSWKLNNLTTINKNKENKNKEIIKKNKSKKDLEKPKLKRTKKKHLPDFYLQYSFFTKEFSEIWFKEFLPMKQRKKASTSERALKSQLKKIAQYSSNNYKTALEILTNSVDAGWSDVYPLKTNNKQNNNQTNNWGTHAHSSYRMDYSVLETKDQDGNIINPGVPYDER